MVDASAFASSPTDWESALFEESIFPSFPSSTFLPNPILSDASHAPEFLDAPLYFGNPFNSSPPLIDGQEAGPSSSPVNWWENPSDFCHNKQAL